MAFTIKPCPIEGLVEILPKVFGDARGYFLKAGPNAIFFKQV